MQENTLIGYHIANTNKLIGRYILRKFDKKANHKISPMQLMIMNYLLKNQDKKVFQQDICDTFNIRRSTVSGILKTMEKNKIIVRVTCSDDPRKKELQLTNKFIRNTNKIKQEFKMVDSILEEGFTKEEKEQLVYLLRKLEGNLIKEERKKDV